MTIPTFPTDIAASVVSDKDANVPPDGANTTERRKRFENTFTIIRNELLEHFAAEEMPDYAVEWYKRNLDYNVLGGKLNRGMSVVDSVEILKGRPLSDEEYLKAAVLGWGVELLQACFLVIDDLMDGSLTRRGQPCYYRVRGVGNIAVNDAGMLRSAVYQLLKTHFREESYYIDLIELFHGTTFQTEAGELVDLITAPEDYVDLSKFSLPTHRLIVIYKTSYYSFYLPVALAMHLCNIPSSYTPTPSSAPIKPYSLARSILIPLGEYFQIQDDFLDYSGTPEQIGKVGTDILDNKCSWCINTALAVATPEQRAILDENYGRKDKEREERVKRVFEEVGLAERFRTYEEDAYRKISGLIESIPEASQGPRASASVLKRRVFTSFLDKIYKRTK